MSITLKLQHVDGIRLRQQMAQEIIRNGNGMVLGGKEWKFEKQLVDGHVREELDQDRDFRRIGADGKKEPLGCYTVYITHGLKNVVIEKKGKAANYEFRNPAIRNQMRVQIQSLMPIERNGKPALNKDGKPILEWKNSGPAQYIPPNSPAGAHVGDGVRVILDEMPT